MSGSIPVVNGFITIYALPLTFPKDKTVAIINDFQRQHYNDHAMFYQTLGGIMKALNIGAIEMSLPNLFFSDTPSWNEFLSNNYADHIKFYEISNQIAEAMVKNDYGKIPILINFMTNPVQSGEYNMENVNRFMLEEYNIHRMYVRYLNILIDNLNNATVPLAGGA